MKVIFLDIDGVLNSDKSTEDNYETHGHYHSMIPHEMHVKWLNYITNKTDASIVISSTWRMGCSNIRVLSHLLYLCGVTGDVIGLTPKLNNQERGNEIQSFLDNYSNSSIQNKFPITNFVILDDDSDMSHLKTHLVLCDELIGLTKSDAEKAIKILEA